MDSKKKVFSFTIFPQLTVYRADSDNSGEIDQAILNAVLKGMHRQTLAYNIYIDIIQILLLFTNGIVFKSSFSCSCACA